MAPDLNAAFAGERFSYSQPGSSGYNIGSVLDMFSSNEDFAHLYCSALSQETLAHISKSSLRV